MKIEDLTIGQAKELACMFQAQNTNCLPFEIGEQYFIRTVTHHHTGRVVRIAGKFLILEDAAWIADDGRFSDAIKTGKLNEIEPFSQEVILNTDTIIDATIWGHGLPREQK